MGSIEDRIRSLGYSLPSDGPPLGSYIPAVSVDRAGLVYTSGNVARDDEGNFVTGKLGADLSVEEGYEAAKLTAIRLLGVLKDHLGDLDRINRIVKLLCMVNSAPDFTEQPAVANGASDFLVEVFGENGRHARSAVGVAALPGNVCVEIEMIAELSQ